MFGRKDIKSLLKSSAFYSSYRELFTDETLATAVYIHQEVAAAESGDHEARFARAEDLLLKYSSANFVVTSRIHCALPCLGIGTPVLYVENQRQPETSWCRLSGLRELLHVVRYEDGELHSDFGDGKFAPELAFHNKDDYRVLADKLSAQCEAYVRSLTTTTRTG
jgi:hypothetical protein